MTIDAKIKGALGELNFAYIATCQTVDNLTLEKEQSYALLAACYQFSETPENLKSLISKNENFMLWLSLNTPIPLDSK